MKRGGLLLIWLAVFGGLSPGRAWYPELEMAADAVGRGAASPAQRNLVFLENDKVNLMRDRGLISDQAYQASQSYFDREMIRRARAAAAEAGVEVRPQAGRATRAMAGQDTDLITSATTPEEISRVKQAFNERLKQDFNLAGSKTDWTRKLDVDFMADANRTSPEAFSEIAKLNNAAYTRPGAARYEAYKRAWSAWEEGGKVGEPPQTRMNDYVDYVEELNEFSTAKVRSAQAMQGELEMLRSQNIGQNPGDSGYARRQTLEAKLDITQAQEAKYLKRLGEANQLAAGQLGLASTEIPELTLKGAIREPELAVNRAVSGALSRSLTEQGIRDSVELLVEVARRNPEQAAECQTAIARLTRDLPLSRKGDLLAALAQKEPEFTQGVVEKMSPPTAGSPALRVAQKTLEVGGRVMMAYAVYDTAVSVATAEDMSHESGKQAGGWLGGSVLGWLGTVVGGAAGGALQGSAVPGWGTLAGAIVGGLSAGYVGHTYGTDIGDTDSAWWDKNRPDAERDSETRARLLPEDYDERLARAHLLQALEQTEQLQQEQRRRWWDAAVADVTGQVDAFSEAWRQKREVREARQEQVVRDREAARDEAGRLQDQLARRRREEQDLRRAIAEEERERARPGYILSPDDARARDLLENELAANLRDQKQMEARRLARLKEAETLDMPAAADWWDTATDWFAGGEQAYFSALDWFGSDLQGKWEAAAQSAAGGWDAVARERAAAGETEAERLRLDADARVNEMRYAVQRMVTDSESALAAARYARENSWGAWLQSTFLDTLSAVAGGFGGGFGGRLGSSIMEQELYGGSSHRRTDEGVRKGSRDDRKPRDGEGASQAGTTVKKTVSGTDKPVVKSGDQKKGTRKPNPIVRNKNKKNQAEKAAPPPKTKCNHTFESRQLYPGGPFTPFQCIYCGA